MCFHTSGAQLMKRKPISMLEGKNGCFVLANMSVNCIYLWATEDVITLHQDPNYRVLAFPQIVAHGTSSLFLSAESPHFILSYADATEFCGLNL